MRTMLALLILVLGVAPSFAAEDHITAIFVPAAERGEASALERNAYVDIKGKDLDSVRKDAEEILAIMGDEETWTDVGPDSAYTSVEILLDGKKRTINTWYPAYRGSDKVAVVESGLVFLDDPKDKEDIESKTSDRYKALKKFLDKVLEKGTAKK